MKSIRDIEKLDIKALEEIAGDESIKVPVSLSERIMSTAVAGAMSEEETESKAKRPARYITYAIAAAAACLFVFLAVPKGPKDTFDDPLMAYAELERTFSYISSKVDKGLDLASEAEPVIEKAGSVFSSDASKGRP